MSNRIVTGIAGIALAAFALGCAENDGPAAPVETRPITITPASIGVDHGATGQLTAVGPNNTSPSVTWESENTAIATVDASGVVTGVSPGRTTINARLTSDATVFRSATATVLALQGTGVQKGVATTVVHDGVRDSGVLYRLFVPAGRTSFTARLTGGTGDADIYVARQTPPTLSTPDGAQTCNSFNAANEELCTITDPVSGTWYVLVAVWDPGTGAQLTLDFAP